MATDVLQRSAEWLARQIEAHASREVRYRRGASVLTTQAAVGRTEFEIDDGQGGVRIEHWDRDFLMRADGFILDGRPAEPQSGDRVEEPTPQGTFIYEVLAPAGHPVWRYDDPYRQMIRVHTKLIKRE